MLFADVVHSMAIAAAVDVERYREIMTELVERSAAVVQRYGGSVEYTGDGVVAILGAPVALEDHAIRACLAAVGVQEEAKRLAVEVRERDGVDLQVRMGLNSGQVIAGEIGSGALGYAAVGEQVGLAQRMESVAPPGAVMLSESTARLVEHTMMLAEPEWVRIKGADDPISARRLVGLGPRDGLVGRAEAPLVGRGCRHVRNHAPCKGIDECRRCALFRDADYQSHGRSLRHRRRTPRARVATGPRGPRLGSRIFIAIPAGITVRPRHCGRSSPSRFSRRN